MNFLNFIIMLWMVKIGSTTTGQFPADCSCPDRCICSLEESTIDCVAQKLKHIPVELNSCSWPGITKL